MEDFFQVGIITSPHGVRGQVKVFPTTDDPKRFKRLKQVLLETGEGRRPLAVREARFSKGLVLLRLEGLESRSDAEGVAGCPLFVPRRDAVKLEKDEYFVADLEGLCALDERGEPLGVLERVMKTGANDVYVIRLTDGRELLLPAIRQCVREVDVAAGYLKIHILEGLLDETP